MSDIQDSIDQLKGLAAPIGHPDVQRIAEEIIDEVKKEVLKGLESLEQQAIMSTGLRQEHVIKLDKAIEKVKEVCK